MTGPRGDSSPPTTALAGVLLLGTVALGIGAALHPMFPADVPGQLAVIAQTAQWRVIHLVMLAGTALIAVGLWGQLDVHDRSERPFLSIAFGVIVLGLLLNASNIAFMAAIGTGDAARYAGGHRDAAVVFALGHGRSLVWARVGNALVASGSAALAFVESKSPREPRYMSVLAALAAVGGLVGVVGFDLASRGAVAAVALFGVWAGAAALRVLIRSPDRFTLGGR
jgi:hypothetical protein